MLTFSLQSWSSLHTPRLSILFLKSFENCNGYICSGHVNLWIVVNRCEFGQNLFDERFVRNPVVWFVPAETHIVVYKIKHAIGRRINYTLSSSPAAATHIAAPNKKKEEEREDTNCVSVKFFLFLFGI